MRDDVRAARAEARHMIALVLLMPLVAVFWFVAQAGGPTPMFPAEPPWYAAIVPWVGWTVYAVGVIWMIRIYRTSHLEPETSNWRYRD